MSAAAVPALLQHPATPSRAEILAMDAPIIMEPPLVPGSHDWHRLRRTGLGGSDIAAALGLSRWRSAFSLWLEKRGDAPPEVEVTDGPLYFGRVLEPVILAAYAQRTGHEVYKPTSTFRSSEHTWMLANLDGLTMGDGRVVEVKTARTREGWGEPGSADIPVAYLCQVQFYMHVLRRRVADVAVLFHGSDLCIYEVPADEELQTMLVEGGAEFWARVVSGEPPDPVGIEDARLRWGALNAKGTVAASPGALHAVKTLREATAHRKDLEGVEAEAKAFLMGELGERGDTLVDAEGHPLVTWKLAAAARRFDAEAFALEHPGLYADYLRAGTASRRFLLKGIPA